MSRLSVLKWSDGWVSSPTNTTNWCRESHTCCCGKLYKQPRKRRRTHHAHVWWQLRAKIGHYAAENGNRATEDKFTAEFDYAIPESSVRNMKLICHLRDLTTGRPLTLGSHDVEEKDYATNLRLAGGGGGWLSTTSLQWRAASRPFLSTHHGDSMIIDKSWAGSLLMMGGHVKRKGTKAAR